MSFEITTNRIEINPLIALCKVEAESPVLRNIAKAANATFEGLQEELSSGKTFLWTVSREGRDIGIICLQRYKSLADLKEQITEIDLAKRMFDGGLVLEASMYLDEKHRGQGVGKTIVQALLERRKEFPYFQNVFMVVDRANQVSQKMLEKRGITSEESYRIPRSCMEKLCCRKEREIRVYTAGILPAILG